VVVTALLGIGDREKLQTLPYTGIMPVTLFGVSALVARTGYTGELGYELYIPNQIAEHCWQALTETEHLAVVKPIGLGARDTLRLEACYLLYGNDMDEGVSPLEAGIGWATKIDKGDFIGRDALIKQKAEGLKRKIVAFKMNEDGIPRHDMPVYVNGNLAGKVTSGSVLPTLGGAGGMALLSAGVKEGDQIEIDVRGKRKLATVAKRPLYSPKVK
jgi:aminomethyltransferase